ncbi:MAG: DNA repair protein RecO [Clostridiales bacterium]|nr:DNA repair protein RecO [Clostridiales bacterium]
MHVTTRAIVLREVNYKESDKILTVLTPDLGKITVQARGCRKKRSGLSAACQLLVWSEMTLAEFRGRWTVTEAEVELEFRTLRSDLEKLALGSYFAEVLDSVVQEEAPPGELLSLLLNCLYALDRLDKSPAQVKAAFELRAVSLAGFEPLVDACAVCGREPEEPRLNLTQGVLHCADCGQEVGEGISLPLTARTLSAMRYIITCPGKKLLSFRMEERELTRLGEVCEAYLLTQLERGFRTLDYYKQIVLRG